MGSARSTAVAADLDDLAEPGVELVRVAATLCDELGQACGVPELGQLTHDGQVRRRYWEPRTGAQQRVEAWAAQHGIVVTDDELAQ